MLLHIVKTLRPHQWIKNLFVAAPLIFARRIEDAVAVRNAAAAIAIFCALSSAVYLFNDLQDVERDRVHPVKRHRPIASGALGPEAARVAAAILVVAGLGAAALLGLPFFAAALAYIANNLTYGVSLKHFAFVDVASISLGFLIRVLAGAAAIPVEPSNWLLACTLLLASLLGFGKRAHELRVAGEAGESQRSALGGYRLEVLRRLLVVLAVATVAVYAAYTQSAHALTFFGTRYLAVTVVFVAFGIFRFVWITSRKLDAESPTDSMLRDAPFVINLALYAVAILFVIYSR